jgi:hypothetical protein
MNISIEYETPPTDSLPMDEDEEEEDEEEVRISKRNLNEFLLLVRK